MVEPKEGIPSDCSEFACIVEFNFSRGYRVRAGDIVEE